MARSIVTDAVSATAPSLRPTPKTSGLTFSDEREVKIHLDQTSSIPGSLVWAKNGENERFQMILVLAAFFEDLIMAERRKLLCYCEIYGVNPTLVSSIIRECRRLPIGEKTIRAKELGWEDDNIPRPFSFAVYSPEGELLGQARILDRKYAQGLGLSFTPTKPVVRGRSDE